MRKAERGDVAPKSIIESSFEFVVRVVKLCQYLDERPGVGRVLLAQIFRAETSVLSNIEEAQAGQSRAGFISKMAIAMKEARETHIRLRILNEAQVVPARRLAPLLNEADELKRIIGAIIVSTKRSGSSQL